MINDTIHYFNPDLQYLWLTHWSVARPSKDAELHGAAQHS